MAKLEENQQYWKNKTEEFAKNPEAVEKELKGLYAKKYRSREAIQKKVEEIMKPYVDELKAKFPKAKIGYRGSLATGTRYKTGGPFMPDNFDVDAYIIEDNLANLFINNPRKFRDCRSLGIIDFEKMTIGIEKELKNTFLGYGKENETFTFRIWTIKEYHEEIIKQGFKNL
mgnify:FL=1